jgi:hypothetical protein
MLENFVLYTVYAPLFKINDGDIRLWPSYEATGLHFSYSYFIHGKSPSLTV